jgi:hypothetical protein
MHILKELDESAILMGDQLVEIGEGGGEFGELGLEVVFGEEVASVGTAHELGEEFAHEEGLGGQHSEDLGYLLVQSQQGLDFLLCLLLLQSGIAFLLQYLLVGLLHLDGLQGCS